MIGSSVFRPRSAAARRTRCSPSITSPRQRDLSILEGVGPLAQTAGIKNWTRRRSPCSSARPRAPIRPLSFVTVRTSRTLWGYIAWRIAGQAGLDLMADAEAARTNPGSDLLVELFKLSGPALILLDELVAYARQLSDDRFEAFLSFIQSLTEAAKMVPGVLIIGSLPESIAEAGGPRVKRLCSVWRRCSGVCSRPGCRHLATRHTRSSAVVCSRPSTPTASGRGDETVKAFADLYKKTPPSSRPRPRKPAIGSC